MGEGLQARAVIGAFRDRRPESQLIFTHYSASAEAFATTVGADLSTYLPYDRPADLDPVLQALHVDLLAFTKLDLWPELATHAAARNTRVALVAATVSPMSGRLRFPARHLSRPGYRALSAAGAISPADAHRLESLGCLPERITVTGDPRIDSVLAVVDATPSDDPLRSLANPANTLVAGSTWPEDERVVLTAFAAVRTTHPGARLIVAPHVPSPEHLAGLDNLARQLRLPPPYHLEQPERLPGAEGPAIVVIDRVGILARAYAVGGMAYVGGGWGTKGIHSVLEPAAWRRPVIIGPRDRGSHDAALLEAAAALQRLPARNAPASLAALWTSWLDDALLCRRAGEGARRVMELERGGAQRNAELLLGLLA